ncbi:MAG: gcrA cell cycle regulator family protein [Rhodospirillales bacterium]|nr:gcrA cell cycle regulator family protein [Rhodospirillales bacterium]
MSWTDERVELLTKLWGEGKTAAEIAKELGGVTRNAVIGKAHRLKLSNRVSPIQQNKKLVAVKTTPSAPSLPERKIQKAAAQDNRQGVPLVDLKANQCRWPLGDPREESFGFCGCKNIAGLPYCSEHAKVAYQAATRNRILKAEEEAARADDVSQEDIEIAKQAIAK